MKFTENSNWRKSMRIKKFLALGMTCCLFMVTPVQSIAAPLETQTDLLVQDQNSFRDLMVRKSLKIVLQKSIEPDFRFVFPF